MIKTTYQTPELRDANDNVIQEGAFGKNSPLTNATNDGAFDYILNNLEALHDTIGDSAPTLDGNGHVVEPANLAIGDEDGNRIKTSYLKLTGGTVTGTTSFRQNVKFQDNQENVFGGVYVPSSSATEQFLQIYGGENTSAGNARLTLYPSGDGHFALRGFSADGGTSYELRSTPTGKLNWRGYPLAWEKDYLPLAGGTMTGFVIFANADNRIRVNYDNNAGQLNLYGGIDMTHGAYLGLNGSNFGNAGGRFSLNASDGTNSSLLVGRPDGTLTWGGKNIERVESSGTNYIRYVSGLQICWGIVTGTANTSSTAITFPQAFVNNSYFGYANTVTSSSTVNVNVGSYSTTGMTAYHTNTSSAPVVRWIAIGKWQ